LAPRYHDDAVPNAATEGCHRFAELHALSRRCHTSQPLEQTMNTLPLPDRSLAAVPLALLAALMIFIAIRGAPSAEPEALPSSALLTDGSGSADSAHAAWAGAALPASPDAFDYTFVFPLHETPNEESRVVRLDVGAP
jgi:hypothetical protein